MIDRESHRAAVEAGYASLKDYVAENSITLQKTVDNTTREMFRITADGRLELGPDASTDEATRALFDAISNGFHKIISDIKADNERLREALKEILEMGEHIVFPIADMTNIARSAFQQKKSE